MEGLQLSKAIAGILSEKKAENIKVLRIEDLTIVTDYIVIAGGASYTQVKSLRDEVEYKMEQLYGISPTHIEGYDTRRWVLLDYDTVIVHIFHPEARRYYDLDKLWADGEEIDLQLD